MEKASKELLRDFVNSQHFTSTTDILNSMKDLFSDPYFVCRFVCCP